MKKIFLAALIFSLSSLCFARVMIQQDLESVGAYYDYSHNCFKNPETTFDGGYSGFAGFSGSLFWEFDSDNLDLPVHFYTGIDTGLSGYGSPIGICGGVNHTVANFGKIILEADACLELGPCFDFFNGIEFYQQLSVDLLAMPASRRGIYGGIGITNSNFPYLAFYKDYGTVSSDMGFAGLRFLLGWKF